MPQLEVDLAPWHDFYTMLGTASATLIGLLFVAASVGSNAFRSGRPAAPRLFLSASVVNFSSILISCLIILSPVHSWVALGLMLLGCSTFGLAHSSLAWRDTLRDNLFTSIDLEDRVWYLALPIVAYLTVAGSAVLLAFPAEIGCTTLAVSMGLLLLTGLHNAWDITLWVVTRGRE